MERVKLEDLRRYRFLSGLAYAPDGAHAAVVVRQADGDDRYDGSIWLYTCADGGWKRLTTLGGETSFCWEDSDTILFPAVRDESERSKLQAGEELTSYYRIRLDGGEAVRAFTIPMRCTGLTAYTNGRFLVSAVVDASRPDLQGLSVCEKEQVLKKLQREKDYNVIDEIPWFQNGKGFTNQMRTRLFLYDPKDGSLSPVTGEKYDLAFYDLRGDDLLCVGFEYSDVRHIFGTMYYYNLASGESRKLLDRTHAIESAVFFGDRILAAMSDNKEYRYTQGSDWSLIDYKTGEISLLQELGHSVGKPSGTDCRLGGGTTCKAEGDLCYYTSARGGYTKLYTISVKGEIKEVTSEPVIVDFFDVKDGKVLFAGFTGMRLQELYALEGEKSVRKSSFNEEYYQNTEISEPEHIEFQDKDGFTIEGWVLKPIGYEKGKKYPAILDIHGGPKTAFGRDFFHQHQLACAKGYFVMICNPRGSDAYGNEFGNLVQNWGTYDYDNLMQFTDVCLEHYPDIDKKRLAVSGGSYGGFMTNWIIGHTDRFAAACSQRSIASWLSFYGCTDIGYRMTQGQMQCNVWDGAAYLWEISPMKYAPNAKTPTLFIHSDEDYRCHLVEGFQMFTGLKLHGVDARMVVFHKENHELSRSGKPIHRERRLQEMFDWFQKYLG